MGVCTLRKSRLFQMAVCLIFEVNMLQATEVSPQAPAGRKIDRNTWLLLNPDVSKFGQVRRRSL